MINIQKFKLLFIAMLLMFMLGNNVKANANEKIRTEKSVVENPIYEGIDIQTYSEQQKNPRATATFYTSSREDAADYLRDQMRKRSDEVIIKIFQPYSSTLAKGILSEATSYSDELRPDEGDYILANYAGASMSCSYFTSGTYTIITYKLRYLSTAEQERLVDEEVKRVLDELNVYNADEYTKIKAVHDWIATNVKYDYSYSRHSTYHAIVNKKVVCQGFASLSYRLLKELNVGVRYISGIGNGGLHAWNIVRIDNRWYNIDNTWDQNTSSYGISYKYFLLVGWDFLDHYRDYEYNTTAFNRSYPMAGRSYQAITYFGLDNSQLYLADGASATIKCIFNSSLVSNQRVVWSSSNESIAKVDANGKVTMVGNGTAVISATTAEGGRVAKCYVTRVVPIKNVILNKTHVTVKIGATSKLTAKLNPSNATIKVVTYKSSNKNVVTVDQSGNIKAVGRGSAVITVTTKEGNKIATCVVTVPTAVTSVKLNKSAMVLDKGKTGVLKATVNPSNAANKNVVFESSNTKVAKVDSNGKVTGVGKGTAVIKVITKDGNKSTTCKVTVQIPVTKITLNKKSLSLIKGKSATLKAVVTPKNATNTKVEYKSSNVKIAKVSKDGKVTAVRAGSAIITARAGGKSMTCKVTVTSPVKKVVLNTKKVTLNKDTSYQLKATITPTDASNKKVTFKSKNTKVVKVSASGKITAIGVGTTTITVTTLDGKKTAVCTVTVKDLCKDAKKAYQAHINKYKYTKYTKEDGKTIFSYAYVDVDKDGIDELIAVCDYSYVVFTYKNGKIVKLGETGSCYNSWFLRYNKTNKTIIVGTGDAGGPSIGIYTIKNNKISSVKNSYYIDTYDYYTNTIAPESDWRYYDDGIRLYGYSLSKMKNEISGSSIKLMSVK